MATIRNVPALRKIVMTSRAVLSLGASKKAVIGKTVRPNTSPVYIALPAAAIVSPPVRDSSRQAAVTDRT